MCRICLQAERAFGYLRARCSIGWRGPSPLEGQRAYPNLLIALKLDRIWTWLLLY